MVRPNIVPKDIVSDFHRFPLGGSKASEWESVRNLCDPTQISHRFPLGGFRPRGAIVQRPWSNRPAHSQRPVASKSGSDPGQELGTKTLFTNINPPGKWAALLTKKQSHLFRMVESLEGTEGGGNQRHIHPAGPGVAGNAGRTKYIRKFEN